MRPSPPLVQYSKENDYRPVIGCWRGATQQFSYVQHIYSHIQQSLSRPSHPPGQARHAADYSDFPCPSFQGAEKVVSSPISLTLFIPPQEH